MASNWPTAGPSFAARAEFIAALRLIAQGLDNDAATTLHSQASSAALTAMKEAQDFIPAGGKLEGELDLPPIVAGHRTPLLKNVPPEQLQAMRALKQYFTFAQEQLAWLPGRKSPGSMALGALGKLHAALADKPNPEIAASRGEGDCLLSGALPGLPAKLHGGERPGRAAGAQRRLRGGPAACWNTACWSAAVRRTSTT